MGAWIETKISNKLRGEALSHPVWVRGLKPLCALCLALPCSRTLCGAWIETTTANDAKQQPTLPLCGCVDRKKQNVENKKGKRRWKVRLPFAKSLIIGN